MVQTIEAPAAAPVLPQPVFHQVTTDLIYVTKNNFRQDFNEEELKELVESVRAKGIVEPLLVRAWPPGLTLVSEDLSQDKRAWRVWRGELPGMGDTPRVDLTGRLSQAEAEKQCTLLKAFNFSLIAGERRLRAAKIAGLTQVPAMVYSGITDEQADELMVIENMQRKDLHALEYADGFSRMIEQHGYTVEQLAKKVDKGTTFIRDLLHLAKLPNSAREAFRGERITKSHCVLIATIPDEKQREEYAKKVIRAAADQAVSVREAKEIKEREYMKDLKGAPFALDDQTLDPAWGYTCTLGSCPHWNGNTPESRQGKRPDICLMPTHYAKLVHLNSARVIANTKESDKVKVLPPEQGKKIFSRYGYVDDSRYVETKDNVYDHRPGKGSVPIQQIVKRASAPVIVTTDHDGKLRTLIKKTDLHAAVLQLGIDSSSYSSSNTTAADKQRAAKKREDNAVTRAVATDLFAQLYGRNLAQGITATPKAIKGLLALAEKVTRDAPGSVKTFLCRSLEFETTPKKYGGKDWEKPLLKDLHASRLASGQGVFLLNRIALVQVLSELNEYLFKEWGRSTPNKEDVAMCAAFGVDITKIEREQRARIKATAKLKATKKDSERMNMAAKPKARVKAA